jgi:hypothetical protein
VNGDGYTLVVDVLERIMNDGCPNIAVAWLMWRGDTVFLFSPGNHGIVHDGYVYQENWS